MNPIDFEQYIHWERIRERALPECQRQASLERRVARRYRPLLLEYDWSAHGAVSKQFEFRLHVLFARAMVIEMVVADVGE